MSFDTRRVRQRAADPLARPKAISLSFCAALFSALIFLALSVPSAHAQAFGTISGEVTDSSGAAVPTANVTAMETGTGIQRTVQTDPQGHYVIPNLRPTQYTLSVTAKGFQKMQQTTTLLANQAATADFQLHIGSAMQSITVTSAVPLVDTTTNTMGDVIGDARMQELPLNGRNAVSSMNLVPGVSGASPSTVTSQSKLPGSTNVNVNGSRDNQTTYSLDGANFVDEYYNVNIPFPFPDALQEFSVQTDNYSARYGGNAGGVVNVVTKSGTNKFHGDLFEYVRNPVFDARNYFATARDELKRNQFGGTIGGPVWIPHIFNGRDHTFFFFGFQGERYRDVTTANSYIPTTAELSGDFSAMLDASNPNNPYKKVEKIIDPTTGCGFGQSGTSPNCTGTTTNIIPTSRFDSAALNIANNYLPQIGGNGQVYYTHPTSQNINEYTLRIDQHISAKDSLMGRYFRDHVIYVPQNPKGNLLGYAAGYDQPVNNAMIQETHTFRANLLNQASFTLSDIPTDKTFTPDSPGPASLGVTGLWFPADNWIQNISINGAFSINGGAKGPFNNLNYGAGDNLSWVIGRHSIDLGVDYTWSSVDLGDQYLSQGQFTFTSDITNNQIASFLLGYLRQFRQGYGEFKNNRDNFWSFYATDSFHVTRRLTLNYGLRYEPYFPWKEIKGRSEVFSIAAYKAGTISQKFPNAPPGLLFPGDPGVPFDGVRGSMTDFAPRVGFAYDVSGNGATSIRGGFGSFYDTQTAGVINNRFADISPFSPQVTLTQPPGPFSDPIQGYTGYYPFPFTYPPSPDTQFSYPLLVITYDNSTKFHVPVTYEYNLAVQHQFPRNWMLQTAYVGSLARHQKETIELDPAQYIPGSKLGVDARRLFAPYYGSISMDGQDINSSFNALETTLKKQSNWLDLTVAYTYSRSLDDVPQGGGDNDIGADSASALPWYDPNRHQFDYGVSGFDHTHRLVASYVLNLPTLNNHNALVREVIGGWENTGIGTLQSGGPITVTAGQDISQTGIGHDRAVEVPSVDPYNQVCTNRNTCTWLNTDAFAKPATGTFGTLGKDTFRGPHLISFDMGFMKNFAFTERMSLKARADFFNVFNHTNLHDPVSVVSNGGFGKVNAADEPRIGQMSLTLTF